MALVLRFGGPVVSGRFFLLLVEGDVLLTEVSNEVASFRSRGKPSIRNRCFPWRSFVVISASRAGRMMSLTATVWLRIWASIKSCTNLAGTARKKSPTGKWTMSVSRARRLQ